MGNTDPAALACLSLSLPFSCHSRLFYRDPLSVHSGMVYWISCWIYWTYFLFSFKAPATASKNGGELCRRDAFAFHECPWDLDLLPDSGTSEAQTMPTSPSISLSSIA